jgi:polyphosphate kinase
MQRNLRRRIEILVPVEDKENRKELDFILNTILSDKRKGRKLISAYQYSRTWKGKEAFEPTRAQCALYEYYRARLEKMERPKKRSSFPTPDQEQ